MQTWGALGWCRGLAVGLWVGLGLLGCSTSNGAAAAGPQDASPDQLSDVGAGWQIGVRVADVTPTPSELATGKLYMGAYGLLTQRGPATGVHDPIYARAMVLRTGRSALALTILDMPGISNRVIHAIADGVSAQTHMPAESIYVGATHSHSTPDLQGLWGHVPASYKQRVIDVTTKTIVDAFQAGAPADLFVSRGVGSNRNRRDWPITDTELTVLDAKAPDGSRIGTLIDFAAHPVVLGPTNLLISRDFVGYTVDYVESKLNAKDKVLYFQGVVGDASPNGVVGTAFDGAKSYGQLVGDAALSAMSQQTKVTPSIYRGFAPWRQDVTNQNFVLLNQGGYLDYDTVTDAGTMKIDTQFSYLWLGSQIQMVVFPGEALTRTGLKVKASMNAPFRLWLGLTSDSLGYFVLSDEWNVVPPDGGPMRNNGYEETVSMGETAGDNSVTVLESLIAKKP
jgi:hypothetical protein